MNSSFSPSGILLPLKFLLQPPLKKKSVHDGKNYVFLVSAQYKSNGITKIANGVFGYVTHGCHGELT